MELSLTDVHSGSAESFERLGAALDALPEQGHIVLEDENVAEQKKIAIARTYLWLLGYLKRDNKKSTIDGDLRDALEHFGAEAELAAFDPDAPSVIEPAVWDALVELAPFETDTNLPEWMKRAPIVLLRAVHARLFAYGFLTKPPTPRVINTGDRAKYEAKLHKALEDFVRVSRILGYSEDDWAVDLKNAAILELLFDHNSLVSNLQGAQVGDKDGYLTFPEHPGLRLTKHARSALIDQFISGLALVELWLLGYGVRPGAINGEGPFGNERFESLHHALKTFIKDRDLKVANPRKIKLTMWFFTEAQALQRASLHDTDIDDADLDTVIKDRSRMTALKKEYKSLGARLLDGARRAYSWIKNWIKRIGRVFKQLIKNIARALNKVAATVFGGLRDMIEVTRQGWRYFFSAHISSRDRRILLHKERDFDMSVFISQDARGVDKFFTLLNLHVDAISLGGRVIGKLWQLIRQIINLTTSALNWLGLLMALAKLGNWLRKTVGLAEESAHLADAFDELDIDLRFA